MLYDEIDVVIDDQLNKLFCTFTQKDDLEEKNWLNVFGYLF